jgi:hypothetical protein
MLRQREDFATRFIAGQERWDRDKDKHRQYADP